MARLKPPYGTTAELTSAVMQERDLAYDTTLDRFTMGDGSAAAGKPLAFKSEVDTLTGDGSGASVTATGSSTARTLAARFADVVNLKDFVTGVADADETTGIQAWLAAITAGKIGYAPAGTYKFTAALSTAATRIAIVGDGPFQTVFKYAGVSTTADLLTIGDGSTVISNHYLHGFRIASDTTMSAGNALRLRRMQRGSVNNIVIDGESGNKKLYHGIYFDEMAHIDLIDFEVYAQGDGIRCRGSAAGGQAGLMLFQGKVNGCAVGLRVGGGMGGVYGDQVDLVANAVNMVVDTTLASEGNREIILGPSFALDGSTTGANLQISDTLATGSAVLHMHGTWNASAATHGLLIDASVNFLAIVSGGTFFNHGGDGLRNASTSAQIVFAPTRVTNCGGYGINSTAVNANIYVDGAAGYWTANSSGNANANVIISALLGQNGTLTHGGVNIFPNTGLRAFDTNASHSLGFVPGSNLTANRDVTVTTGDSDRTLALDTWTAYTPTITSGTGTFTSVSAVGAWQRIGTTINVRVAITITTNGTAATDVRFSLPATSAGNVTGVGGGGAGRNNTPGPMLQCFIPASSTIAVLNQYDNVYPGADGYLLLAWATFEG